MKQMHHIGLYTVVGGGHAFNPRYAQAIYCQGLFHVHTFMQTYIDMHRHVHAADSHLSVTPSFLMLLSACCTFSMKQETAKALLLV
jgi:hypothetical protein